MLHKVSIFLFCIHICIGCKIWGPTQVKYKAIDVVGHPNQSSLEKIYKSYQDSLEIEMKEEVAFLDTTLSKAKPESTLGNHAAEITLKQEHGYDMVICLSHLGHKYESNKVSDTLLAQASENIDLIIEGHTHTFLNQPDII